MSYAPQAAEHSKSFESEAGFQIKNDDSKFSDPMAEHLIPNSKRAAKLWHFMFKTLALILYIFAGILFESFVFPFVLVVILLSLDFWTVKNISGRYLVGLRWWSRIDPDESNSFIFEYKDPRLVNHEDSNLFWNTLYGVPVIWGLLALVSIFRFSFGWTTLCIVAIAMGSTNISAYDKCDKYAKSQLKKGTREGFAGFEMFSNVKNMFSKVTIAKKLFT